MKLGGQPRSYHSGTGGGLTIGLLGLAIGGFSLYHDLTGAFWELPKIVLQVSVLFVSLVLLATHAKLRYHMWTKNTFFHS